MATKRYKQTKRNKRHKRNTKKWGGSEKLYVTQYDDITYIKICNLVLERDIKNKTLDLNYLIGILYGPIFIEHIQYLPLQNLHLQNINIEGIKEARVEFMNDALNRTLNTNLTQQDIDELIRRLPVRRMEF